MCNTVNGYGAHSGIPRKSARVWLGIKSKAGESSKYGTERVGIKKGGKAKLAKSPKGDDPGCPIVDWL